MARTRSTSSIDAEIGKLEGKLARLRKRQEALSGKLLSLQRKKREMEAALVMDAFRRSGRTLQELLVFLGT